MEKWMNIEVTPFWPVRWLTCLQSAPGLSAFSQVRRSQVDNLPMFTFTNKSVHFKSLVGEQTRTLWTNLSRLVNKKINVHFIVNLFRHNRGKEFADRRSVPKTEATLQKQTRTWIPGTKRTLVWSFKHATHAPPVSCPPSSARFSFARFGPHLATGPEKNIWERDWTRITRHENKNSHQCSCSVGLSPESHKKPRWAADLSEMSDTKCGKLKQLCDKCFAKLPNAKANHSKVTICMLRTSVAPFGQNQPAETQWFVHRW